MKPTLYMTKGLPGSGKTTWALKQLEANQGWKRVNKDDLRAMIDGSRWSNSNEKFIKHIRDLIIEQALADGRTVIVDDTNLAQTHENRLRVLADACGANFEIKSFLDVPIETCIERDLKRLKSVGEHVIRRMYRDFVQQKVEPYCDLRLAPAIICDIDGTLAIKSDRSPYDWERVGEDKLNVRVCDILRYFESHSKRPQIILFSGRDSVCKEQTVEWLRKWEVPFDQLVMRPQSDNRKDSIVKEEMFREYIKGKFDVLFVLDDRNQVVEMWRDIGLTCLQVADGDF